MTRPFTGFLMLEAALIAAWVAWTAVRRRSLSRAQVLALMALQLIVVLHGLISLASLAFGHDAAEAGTHVAYLLASLVVLPVLIGVPVRLGFPATAGGPGTAPEFIGGIDVTPPEERPAGGVDRWRALVAALACGTVLVMAERMWATWQS